MRDQGFTLVETLVAISILSISLVVILQLFSGGLKSGKLSEDYTCGIFHAREKMEEILIAGDFREGRFGGEFEDGYMWEAEVLYMEPKEEEKARLPFDTFNINVDIGWDAGGGKKHFRVSTMKLTEKVKR